VISDIDRVNKDLFKGNLIRIFIFIKIGILLLTHKGKTKGRGGVNYIYDY